MNMSCNRSRMEIFHEYKKENKVINIHIASNSVAVGNFLYHKSLKIKLMTNVCIIFSCLFIANPKDWSDHALWWPARNIWLTRTRSTLDQVGLHADALLHFTPMHKILRVQVSFDFYWFAKFLSSFL